MSSKPQLSVIIPTYNGADRLPLLLSSIVDDRPDLVLDVLIGDDGSEQNIESAVAPFRQFFPLVVKRQFRNGERSAAARNLALSGACGEIALFLDDDVVIEPGLLAAHVNWHATNKVSLLVGMRARNSDDSYPKSQLFERVSDHRQHEWHAGSAFPPWYFVYSCHMSVPMPLARIEFDEQFVGWGLEDLEFAYRLWRQGVRIDKLSDPLVTHIDTASLRDPFRQYDTGEFSSFNSFVENTARFFLKHADESLQSILLAGLDGLAYVDGTWRRDETAKFSNEALAWGIGRVGTRRI